MNLWKVELILLFRSWRGWTLVSLYFLASILSVITNYFIDKANEGELVPYADVIEMYLLFTIPAADAVFLWKNIAYEISDLCATERSSVSFYFCHNLHFINGNV